MHRPFMDWAAAERRHDAATVEGRLWAGLQRLIAARRATRAIHVQGRSEPRWTGNDHVFAVAREQAGERLLVVANFTADPQRVALEADDDAAAADGRPLLRDGDDVVLAPYQFLWLRG
jgi:amylosucrase